MSRALNPQSLFRGLESALAIGALLLMALLPVIDLSQRNIYGRTVFGAAGLVEHLTLWAAFLGAAIATRTDSHLKFAAHSGLPDGVRLIFSYFTSFVSTAVSFGLTVGAVIFIRAEMESPVEIGGVLPVWVINAVLPVAFAIMTWRFVTLAKGTAGRVFALLGVGAALALGFLPAELFQNAVTPGIIVLILAGVLGAPIFVVIGGASLLLFASEGVSIAAIPVETYRIVTSPLVPAIPLFTLTGYMLSHGHAANRLIAVFRSLFASFPGGLVISTTVVCAFFSALTGASGVTILALGGLLLPVLTASGFSNRFSTGLITSTGSIGLLFPPSLAVIMYAVVTKMPIADLFLAGLIPGLIMVAAISLVGVINDPIKAADRPKFSAMEALKSVWVAKWELALPPFIIFAIFSGFSTLIEAAAMMAVYVLFIQIFIHREMNPFRDLPEIGFRSINLTGGIFIILGVALGLNNYFVDASIPYVLREWAEANIDSRIQFLLMLNAALIVVGALMDITSAIIVVVPLIVPIAHFFGIHPLHLAIIFLVNLELGYLTPPVGMNLFLASFRFEKSLTEIYLSTLPFFAILLAVLMLVTFAPFLIIGAN